MRFLFITLMLSLSFSITHGQTTGKPPAKKNKSIYVNKMFDINLKCGVPMNDFQKSTLSIPFGVEGALMWAPSNDYTFYVGLDLGWMQMGSKTENENIPVDITANGTLIDHFDIPLKFTISNSITTGHLVLRITSPTKVIKLYGEGVAGFNYLNTHTTVTDESDKRYLSAEDNNVIFDKSQQDDWTYSLGGGGGLLIKLGRYSNLNLKASYLVGGPAKYFDKSDISNWDIHVSLPSGTNYNSTNKNLSNSEISFGSVPRVSRTDMLVICLGINFLLD